MNVAAETTIRVRQTARPQLRVRNVAAAIDFYTRAFGARELMRFEAGGRIPHAEIEIGESLIVLADEAPEYGFLGPDALGGSPVTIQLFVPNVDELAAQAVAAGARLVSPVADQFYGDRTGRLIDPFGHSWTIATRVEELSLEEMYRRLAALEGSGRANPTPSVAREGFHTVTPYVVVADAPALIEFVTKVFGAEERSRSIGPAGGIHAEVRIGDSMLMIGGGAPGLSVRPHSIVSAFHVYVEDVDLAFRRAVDAGGTVIHAVTDMEYGERSGGVKDGFGNCWYIATAAGPHHVPEGLQTVNVYLHPHRAEPVIAFLARAFGAQPLEKYASPEGIVHHAKVRLGDSIVEMGEAHGAFQPMPTRFYVYVPNVDGAYTRAMNAGALSLQQPADQPFGERTAGVKDPFGNQWYLARPLGPRR